MSVSTVDGTIECVELRRETRRHSIFNFIVIRREDGSEARIAKAVVAAQIAKSLVPGTRGRFYLYRAIDQRGIHGVRTSNGQATFGYPTTNERLMLMVLVVNAILLIARLALEGFVWILPLVLIVFATIVYPLYRRGRLEARAQFNQDEGYNARG